MPLYEIKSRLTDRVIYGENLSTTHPKQRNMATLVERAVRRGIDLTGADLSFLNLSDTNLRGAKLARAKLDNSTVAYCNLEGADLVGATLRNTNMHGSILSKANLERAWLARTQFVFAVLEKANLHGAELMDVNFSKTNLTGTKYKGVALGRCGAVAQAKRSDMYNFQLMHCADGKWRVMAGCRWFTLPQAWKHWENTRRNTDLGEETYDILVMFEHQAARMDKKLAGV
jgi:uncharacterized protein YjbI with pentapeptide repeats